MAMCRYGGGWWLENMEEMLLVARGCGKGRRDFGVRLLTGFLCCENERMRAVCLVLWPSVALETRTKKLA